MSWNGLPITNLDKDNGYHYTVLNGSGAKLMKGVLESNGFSVIFFFLNLKYYFSL